MKLIPVQANVPLIDDGCAIVTPTRWNINMSNIRRLDTIQLVDSLSCFVLINAKAHTKKMPSKSLTSCKTIPWDRISNTLSMDTLWSGQLFYHGLSCRNWLHYISWTTLFFIMAKSMIGKLCNVPNRWSSGRQATTVRYTNKQHEASTTRQFNKFQKQIECLFECHLNIFKSGV